MIGRTWCFLLLALAGCDGYPKDPEGTLQRVRAEGAYRVGVIAPGDELEDREKVGGFLARLSRDVGAQPRIDTGPTDTLLTRLEHGQLDLVVGHFIRPSPWKSRVSLSPPFAWKLEGSGTIELAAAARNGENAWIARVHRAADETAAASAAEAAAKAAGAAR